MKDCLRKTGRAGLLFAFILSAFMVMGSVVYAATITVGPGAEDYASIQDAIDAATEGDTILVSPCTYTEAITIDVSGLTIQSTTGAATTIINSVAGTPWGVRFGCNNVIFDGFTVRDFDNENNEDMIIRIGYMDGPYKVADGNVVTNCIIQGNLNQPGVTTAQTDFGIVVYGKDNQILNNEVFDIGYVGINVPTNYRSDEGNNTVSGNNVHDIGLYAITVDRSPNNNVIMNQISHLVGGDLWGDYYDPTERCYAIVAWGASAEGTVISGHNLSGIPNGISLSSACGVNVLENSISADNVGVKISTGWAGPIADNNVITGNTITTCATGVLVSPGEGSIGADNFVEFNNIEGNTMGANNTGTDEFVAENNWWGDATGPYNETTNPEGLGDEVSNNFLFEPWLSSPLTETEIIDSENPSSENGEDGIAVDVEFGGEEGVVLVAAYGGDPVGDAPFDGTFFDVFIPEIGDIAGIVLKLYYNEPTAKVAYWHNGEEWIVCSDQEVVEGAVMLEDVMYDGYVEVTINNGTTPSLDDLTGTVFALRETPVYDSVSGQGGCFIATAAFGSPFERHVKVLREFRDRYLLTNPVGQAFVRWYYRHSPQYASVIANNNILKTAARTALLPLYGVAFMALKGVFAYLVFGLGLLLLFALRRKTAKVVAVLLVAVLISMITPTAFAADGNHFDISPGDKYTVVVPTTSTIGHLKMSTDIFYSYGNRVIEVELAGTEMDLVENQHLLQLGLTFGICDIQQISIVVPYVADQISDIGGTGSSGLGDISVIYKYRFPLGNENGLKFAIAPYVQFDSGKDNIYMNAGSNVYGIRFIMDKKLGENVLFTGNLGYAYQSEEDLGDNIEIDQTLLFGTGMVFMIPETPSYIAAEIHGRSEELFDTENTPVEAMLSYGCAMEHATFTIGGGLGLIDGYGAPDWRLFTGLRFML